MDLGAGVEWNNWEFGIHIENLFDEDYYIDVQEFPNFAGSSVAERPGRHYYRHPGTAAPCSRFGVSITSDKQDL